MGIKKIIGYSLIAIADLLEKLQWLFRKIIPMLLVLILGFGLGFFVTNISNHREALQKQKVEEFIEQIITSAIEQTEFHKKHSSNHAIDSIQKEAKNFSNCYKIRFMDVTFNAYEFTVIFDNGSEFYVDVIVFGDDITLNIWSGEQ